MARFTRGVLAALGVLVFSPACGGSSSAHHSSIGSLSVFAGVPSGAGNIDGPGSAARFYIPESVAVDAAGNVYVADTGNHAIRKITPAGVVSTLASMYARGVAVDGAGNVYAVDVGDSSVWKITPAGGVSTLAGTWQNGSADGAGSAASFSGPCGVAVDGSGNVYVADTGNNTIRKITPEGIVTTLAGLAGYAGSTDGVGAAASFNQPYGVAVDGSGNVYVADTGNRAIRKITPAGVVSTLAASFNSWSAVAVDGAGNVYVAGYFVNCVQEITPAGVVNTLAGDPGQVGSTDGTGSAARFFGPSGVAVDASGNVFVADEGNNVIRQIAPAGEVTTLAGSAGQVGSTDGTGSAASFHEPWGIAVDAADNLYVSDWYNGTIRKITPDGVVTTLAGVARQGGGADGTGAAARFYDPCGVAVDGSGNLYVADSGNSTIRKITPEGAVSTLAGTAGQFGSTDGTGAAALFDGPQGVAVDGTGNVYVADTGNGTIRKITPDGVVSTLAGTAGQVGSTDGIGPAARFFWPTGMAMDGAGNVYVADSENGAIRKITPAGVVTTLTGSTARFAYPEGVAVDGAGNVYVAVRMSNTIRKITPAGVVTTVVGTDGEGEISAGPLPARVFTPHGVAFSPRTGRLFITVPDAVLEAIF